MIGSSSTWYAISARCRSSRSSAARAAGSEDVKELLGGVDDRIGLLRLELRSVVDPAPGDGDRSHPGRLGSAHVERRVADVRGLGRVGAHPLGREQERFGVRLVALRLVAADDGLEQVAYRD